MLNNTGLRFAAALVLLLGLWTGSSVAAEPAWEQAADLLSWGVGAGVAVPVLSRASAAGMGAKDLTALEDRFAAGVAKGRPTQALAA